MTTKTMTGVDTIATAGAKRIFLSMESASNVGTVTVKGKPEGFTSFQQIGEDGITVDLSNPLQVELTGDYAELEFTPSDTGNAFTVKVG